MLYIQKVCYKSRVAGVICYHAIVSVTLVEVGCLTGNLLLAQIRLRSTLLHVLT